MRVLDAADRQAVVEAQIAGDISNSDRLSLSIIVEHIFVRGRSDFSTCTISFFEASEPMALERKSALYLWGTYFAIFEGEFFWWLPEGPVKETFRRLSTDFSADGLFPELRLILFHHEGRRLYNYISGIIKDGTEEKGKGIKVTVPEMAVLGELTAISIGISTNSRAAFTHQARILAIDPNAWEMYAFAPAFLAASVLPSTIFALEKEARDKALKAFHDGKPRRDDDRDARKTSHARKERPKLAKFVAVKREGGGARPAFSGKCFKCGKEGHKASQCQQL